MPDQGKWDSEKAKEAARKSVEARRLKKLQAQGKVPDSPVDLSEVDARPHIPEQPPIRKPSPEAASQKELENWLGATLGLITFGLALWLAEGANEAAVADAVALTDEELDALVPALARLIARSPLNKRYGKMLIQSNDWIGAMMALAQYGTRVWPLVRMKMERSQHVINAKPLQAVPVTGDNAGSNGNGSAPGPAPGVYSAYQS